MLIQNCQFISNMKASSKSKIPFKHILVLDIGSSNPKGTVKLSAKTDDGKEIYKKDLLYLNDTKDGFENSQDFVNRINKIVMNAHKDVVEICKTKNLGEKEEKLSGLALFVPGSVLNNKVIILLQILDKAGAPLRNIDFSEYERNLKSTNELQVSPDFKLIARKDLCATGLGLVKILKSKNLLKEDDYVVGIMTGGGFGSVEVKLSGDKLVKIENSESGSDLVFDEMNNEILRMGELGPSAKGLIANYLKALGLDEMVNLLLKVGDSRLVTKNEITLDNLEDMDIINKTLENSVFIIKNKNQEKTVLEINPKLPIAQKMKYAQQVAINKYSSAIAQHLISKVNKSASSAILVGKVAHGVNDFIKENSTDYSADNLSELISHKMDDMIKKYNLKCTSDLSKTYNFKIICDDEINFADNTYAGELLFNSKSVRMPSNRGEWLEIAL